jgi:hypothetical protein
MPKPTVMPLVLAVAVMALGYAMLFRSLPVAIVAGIVAIVSLHRQMFSVDPGEFMRILPDDPTVAAQGGAQ